jgi:t-SNARE complex subunit (syntaxin)
MISPRRILQGFTHMFHTHQENPTPSETPASQFFRQAEEREGTTKEVLNTLSAEQKAALTKELEGYLAQGYELKHLSLTPEGGLVVDRDAIDADTFETALKRRRSKASPEVPPSSSEKTTEA